MLMRKCCPLPPFPPCASRSHFGNGTGRRQRRLPVGESAVVPMALLLLGVGLSTPVPVPDSGGGSILSPNQSLRRKEAHKVQVRCNPGAYTSINPVGKSGENMTRWCEANCLVGFCPSDMCKCSDDSATLLPVNESAVAAPRTWRNGGWIDSDSQAEDASEEALAEWERREASEEALADWSKRKERKNEKAMKKSSGGNGADANGPYHGADGEYRGGADAESSIVCQALSQTVTDHWCRTTCTTRWGKLGSCPKKYCKCTDEGGAQSLTPSPVPMSRESARSGVDRWQGSTDQQQEEGRKAVTAHKEAQQAAAAAVKAEQEKSARATKDAEDALDKAKREALQQGSVADDEWEKQEGEQEEEQQEEQQEEKEQQQQRRRRRQQKEEKQGGEQEEQDENKPTNNLVSKQETRDRTFSPTRDTDGIALCDVELESGNETDIDVLDRMWESTDDENLGEIEARRKEWELIMALSDNETESEQEQEQGKKQQQHERREQKQQEQEQEQEQEQGQQEGRDDGLDGRKAMPQPLAAEPQPATAQPQPPKAQPQPPTLAKARPERPQPAAAPCVALAEPGARPGQAGSAQP